MKRLLRYFRGYGKETFLAPLFKMLEAFFDLLVPMIVARIISVGIAALASFLPVRRIAAKKPIDAIRDK